MLDLKKKDHSIAEKPKAAMPLPECLAKTYSAGNGNKCAGRQVLSHCRIVGEVAREIIARLPCWLSKELFSIGSELTAAAHDIGKISPTFQEKIYRGIDGYQPNSKIELENTDPGLENDWGGHSGVSQATVKEYNDGIEIGRFIPKILGQHHGYSINLGGKTASAEVFGGYEWQKQRETCLAELKSALQCPSWPKIKSDLHAMVLAGLTTVADWVGSCSLFDNPNKPWQPLIKEALDNAGFVPPKIISGLSFEEIFGFAPRDAQKKLIAAAIQPGVYIMEAPMGIGKTEAALYSSYLAMIADKAIGIYFALPTQLTSDKIHDRVNLFLRKILAKDCRHRKALLLHKNSWLKHNEFGEDGQPGGAWFDTKKKGILAPFAVGTIDQALMAVMNVKHGFVRTFGLAGKVIILDEVHSYDVYTGTILDKLVKALRELHCTVIILSATLTKDRRYALLNLSTKKDCYFDNPKKQQELESQLSYTTTKKDYPLISSFPKNSDKPREVFVETPPDKKINIRLCRDNAQAIEEALIRAEQGQQVLWIENTVDEAQDVYIKLAARADGINIECGLLHSRFLKIDRECNEAKWVTLYGQNGEPTRQHHGRILIGTQVLEQSLDIDADFLVTKICPTDMLLQRLGRLWRHEKTIRSKLATQEAWIIAPILANVLDGAKRAFGKTSKIYSSYVLYRSLEVWEEVAKEPEAVITLPRDIRSLVENTYVKRDECNDVIRCYQKELEDEQKKLQRLALIGLSKGGTTWPENKASTRYGEQDYIEVLLIRSYRYKDDKSGIYVIPLNGPEIYLPRHGRMLNNKRRRNIAIELMKNTVRVAGYLAPKAIEIKNLWWLKHYIYLGDKNDDDSLLRIAKVQKDDGLIALDGGEASEKYFLFYDSTLGYRAKKRTNN